MCIFLLSEEIIINAFCKIVHCLHKKSVLYVVSLHEVKQ
jgi:hypothetical protein